MDSTTISKLLRTKPNQYIIKDYTSKHATSSCWLNFGLPAEITNETTKDYKIIEGFASCKKCLVTFAFRPGSKGTGTKNLSDHNCSKKDVNQPTLHQVIEEKNISNEHRSELIDSIAKWCAESIRPFQVVEDPGFVVVSQLLLDVGARYGRSTGKLIAEKMLPCANTIKRRIHILAEEARTDILPRLSAAGARGELAFSPDLWTDRHKKQAYLGMTAIFMEDFTTYTFDMCCREFLYESKTALNISKSIDDVLSEFNVQRYRSSATFIIDRGSNLKAAFSPGQIVHCTTHRIHNILRDTFGVPKTTSANTNQTSGKRKRKDDSDDSDSDSSDDEFDGKITGPLGDVIGVINGCKRMVRYIKKVGLNRKIQEKGGLCVVQENQTRWLSMHAMLSSIDRSYEILIMILSAVNKLDLLTSINRKMLKDIIWFLEPFRHVILDLQTKDRPTLPMVVPSIWYLKDELKTTPIDSAILCFLKDRCITILEHKIELQDRHFAAAMLTQIIVLCDKQPKIITKSTAISTQIDRSSSDDDDSHYLSKYVDNPRLSRKQDELTRYLRFDHRETNTNDIIGFWKTMADSLPNLAKVASQILIVPGTSASVEHSFSSAGQVISDRRSNILPDVVNDIIFLRSAKKMK